MDLRSRIQGGIVGHLVGNALGHRYTKQEKSPTLSSVSQLLARSYTEAGAMSLCSMASIEELGTIDLEDIVNLYHEWYLASYLAPTCETPLRSRITISQSMRFHNIGMPADRCGSMDEYADDSALVRILPIAIWCHNDSAEQIVNQVEAVTKFTNRQTEALVCSALYSFLVRGILLDKKEKIAEALSNYYQILKLIVHDLTLKKIIDAKDTSPRTALIDLFWAMWATYAQERQDYEKAITLAFQSSEDYESIGCLVGSLVGLTTGIDGIPKRWVDQLELPEEGYKIINQFVNAASQQS